VVRGEASSRHAGHASQTVTLRKRTRSRPLAAHGPLRQTTGTAACVRPGLPPPPLCPAFDPGRRETEPVWSSGGSGKHCPARMPRGGEAPSGVQAAVAAPKPARLPGASPSPAQLPARWHPHDDDLSSTPEPPPPVRAGLLTEVLVFEHRKLGTILVEACEQLRRVADGLEHRVASAQSTPRQQPAARTYGPRTAAPGCRHGRAGPASSAAGAAPPLSPTNDCITAAAEPVLDSACHEPWDRVTVPRPSPEHRQRLWIYRR
jgi:hypothetical protein